MRHNALELTKLLVYGTKNPEDVLDPNTLIRRDGIQEAPIYEIVMSDHLESGAGRYAKPAQARVLEHFFYQEDNIYGQPIPDGTFTFEELGNFFDYDLSLDDHGGDQKKLGKYLDSLLGFGFKQYFVDPTSPDYYERIYLFGSNSFRLDHTSLLFKIEDGNRSVEYMELLADKDNFDFQSNAGVAFVPNLFLKGAFDPYGLVPLDENNIPVSVELKYTGDGKVIKNYDETHFKEDIKFINDRDSYLKNGYRVPVGLGLMALEGVDLPLGLGTYLGPINASREFSYFSQDGKKIIYGTPGDDNLDFFDSETAITPNGYKIVGGHGNDKINGFVTTPDELWGGPGNDILTGGGTDTFVDSANYSGESKDYQITYSEDRKTVTIAHLGGTGADGTDTLTGIEVAKFADKTIKISGDSINLNSNFQIVDSTQSRSALFKLERNGDTSFPLIVQVSSISIGGNIEVLPDFFVTLPPGADSVDIPIVLPEQAIAQEAVIEFNLSVVGDDDQSKIVDFSNTQGIVFFSSDPSIQVYKDSYENSLASDTKSSEQWRSLADTINFDDLTGDSFYTLPINDGDEGSWDNLLDGGGSGDQSQIKESDYARLLSSTDDEIKDFNFLEPDAITFPESPAALGSTVSSSQYYKLPFDQSTDMPLNEYVDTAATVSTYY